MSFDRSPYLSIFLPTKSLVRRTNDFQKEHKDLHLMYKNEKLFSKDTKGSVYGGSLGSHDCIQNHWTKLRCNFI